MNTEGSRKVPESTTLPILEEKLVEVVLRSSLWKGLRTVRSIGMEN
jgi:hypothetical protein